MPGSGKTRLALHIFQHLRQQGVIDQLVVGVPTVHLRRQWGEAAAAMGIELDWMVKNDQSIRDVYDGAVLTYSQIYEAASRWSTSVNNARTLLVLDEVHRLGDQRGWGSQMELAGKPALKRLLLSGTPFRGDGAAIPFVAYNSADRCIPHFTYDYHRAVTEGVCRPASFVTVDAVTSWQKGSHPFESRLSQADDEHIGAALSSAYRPDGEWSLFTLTAAHQKLTQHRQHVPDAGGLVIASHQHHARAYAETLAGIAGGNVPVAISDEPDAHQVITEFAHGTSPWLVAVDMVSEGVDIPRVSVGVYASAARTRRYFVQSVGRMLRRRHQAPDVDVATIYMPAVQDLSECAMHLQQPDYPSLTAPRHDASTTRDFPDRARVTTGASAAAEVSSVFEPVGETPTPQNPSGQNMHTTHQ